MFCIDFEDDFWERTYMMLLAFLKAITRYWKNLYKVKAPL